jgi:hypothetical protein
MMHCYFHRVGLDSSWIGKRQISGDECDNAIMGDEFLGTTLETTGQWCRGSQGQNPHLLISGRTTPNTNVPFF